MSRIFLPNRLAKSAASIFVVFLATTIATAQDKTPNTAPVEAYLESQSTVVGWVDLAQIDLDAMTEFAQTFDSRVSDMTQAKAIQSALVQLGVTRTYWVSDLASLSQGPQAVIIPVPPDRIDAVHLLLKTLGEEFGGTAVIDGNCVLVGNKGKIDDLQDQSGEPNPEFLSIINRIDQPHAIALKTPVAALIPVMSVLPEIFGRDDPRITAAAELLVDVTAVTLSGPLPPAEFELQVETKSNASAEGIAALINDWTTSEIKQASQPIRMHARGNRVELASTSMQDTSAVVESLKLLASPARHRTRRRSTLNSLKNIALAMHNFHDSYGHLPPQALADKDGQRLLSWRVLILPFLDNVALYQEFHLDESWDSPHNIKLVSRMPLVYQGSQVDEAAIAAGRTRMVAPLTKNSTFGKPGGGMRFQDIKDGMSNTLMIVEAAPDQAVVWTKPEDVTVSAENPLVVLLDAAAAGFHACMCDGSARLFPKTIDAATLNAMLSIDGQEIIDFGKL